jgi:hypothetical protein
VAPGELLAWFTQVPARSLLGWLAAAEGAGLDEDGIVALFTSVLRDSVTATTAPIAAARRPQIRDASHERDGNQRPRQALLQHMGWPQRHLHGGAALSDKQASRQPMCQAARRGQAAGAGSVRQTAEPASQGAEGLPSDGIAMVLPWTIASGGGAKLPHRTRQKGWGL